MKTMKNNKGMAMVTVLIAISFIIILASSLVYMSYMNYITKAVRFASTDNFYTNEFALDDLCMSLQQTASGRASVADAQTALRNAVGAATNANGKLQYNNDAVAALIQVASQEATISVNTIVPTSDGVNTVSDNVIISSAGFKLVGVEVTSTTAQGYRSTISTDITITFPNGGLGDLDINDFSVISDAPVTVNKGDVFFSGCVFISKKDGEGDGHTALTVNNNANVHILSTRGIINGDIVINGNSVVSITGMVTVTGDIYVNGNSTLLCSENMQHKGRIHVASNARVVGTTDFGEQDINTDSIDNLANGLTGELFTDIYVRSRETHDFRAISLEDFQNGVSWTYHNASYTTSAGANITVYAGLGTQSTTNNEFNNALVMTHGNAVIKGTLTNSSVVCSGTLIFDEASMATYMQNMSDEIYEAAKSVLIREGRNLCSHGNWSLSVQNPDWGSGLWDDSLIDSAEDRYEVYCSDGSIRTFVYNNGKMYVPCGYFLVPDTSSIITGVFTGVQGNADPGNTSIIIENWNKE